MDQILIKIKEMMSESIRKYLPEVSKADLEGSGAVYYMNGKNGTEFDWYVNNKISDFMMFYGDKDNMGAVKATLYNSGVLQIFVYGDRGKRIVQEINANIDAAAGQEILALAALLRNEADDRKIWDADIEKINTDIKLGADKLKEYVSNESQYHDMKERKDMLGQFAYVSRKVLDEGWKVGYMCREKAERENESGWQFMAGNEDDEYLSDFHNIAIMSVQSLVQLDRTVWKYITAPVGTRLIRVSSEEFETDKNDREIYLEKR